MTDSCLRVKLGMRIFSVSLDSSETIARGKLRLQEQFGRDERIQVWFIFDSPSSMIILEDEKTLLQSHITEQTTIYCAFQGGAWENFYTENKEINVIVNCPGNARCFMTSVFTFDTIKILKERLSKQVAILVPEQFLMLRNQVLDSSKRFVDYFIQDQDVLVLHQQVFLRTAPKQITLSIKHQSKKEFGTSVIVYTSYRVKTLKNLISAKLCIHIDSYRLVYAGQQLEDHEHIDHYGIQDNDTIFLISKLPVVKQHILSCNMPRFCTVNPNHEFEFQFDPEIVTRINFESPPAIVWIFEKPSCGYMQGYGPPCEESKPGTKCTHRQVIECDFKYSRFHNNMLRIIPKKPLPYGISGMISLQTDAFELKTELGPTNTDFNFNVEKETAIGIYVRRKNDSMDQNLTLNLAKCQTIGDLKTFIYTFYGYMDSDTFVHENELITQIKAIVYADPTDLSGTIEDEVILEEPKDIACLQPGTVLEFETVVILDPIELSHETMAIRDLVKTEHSPKLPCIICARITGACCKQCSSFDREKKSYNSILPICGAHSTQTCIEQHKKLMEQKKKRKME